MIDFDFTTEVCDAWPARRRTYGYLPSRRASPPLDRYQIVLLCVWTTCRRLLPESGTAGSRTRDLLWIKELKGKKRSCSEVPVNSPENPRSQSWQVRSCIANALSLLAMQSVRTSPLQKKHVSDRPTFVVRRTDEIFKLLASTFASDQWFLPTQPRMRH